MLAVVALGLVTGWGGKGRPEAPQRAIRHTPQPLDPDQVSELVAAFEAGVEVKQLATVYGINRSTVQDHLKRRGVRRRRRKLNGAAIEKIVGLYLQGWTIEAIGPELRVGASTVRRALLNRTGVEDQEARPKGLGRLFQGADAVRDCQRSPQLH
jgi:DNA invertase Pin-like site-specific DNA recombinase